MKKYRAAFFDLDGTLTDPALGITNSLMYSLEKFGIHVNDRTSLYQFIGPPLYETYEEYYHFSKEQSEAASEYYREYFTEKGMYENRIFDGITDMLSDLRRQKILLAVASAKPEIHVKEILRYFKIYDRFDFIGGADKSVNRVRKEEVFRYVLPYFKELDKSEIIMIGDRKDDVIGAKKNQLKCGAVLYGFGTREELTAAGAEYLIKSVQDLHKYLIEGFPDFSL